MPRVGLGVVGGIAIFYCRICGICGICGILRTFNFDIDLSKLQSAFIAFSWGSAAAPPGSWDKGCTDKHHMYKSSPNIYKVSGKTFKYLY